MSTLDAGKVVDYDIHGFVGVRLVNPTDGDVAAVARQLGPLRKTLDREPDITLRFLPELPIPDLHYLGLNKCGYNQKDFFILRSSKRDARVVVSFDQLGKKVTYTCQSGLKSVPLLLAMINLSLLQKDVVALHASAFNYKGCGIVVTGWAKGGKTEALLAFSRQGAEYVGDEWIYLTSDGKSMYGIPENIRLWDWHLDNLPHLKNQIGFEKKALFSVIHMMAQFERVLPKGGIGRTFPIKFFREALPAFQRQLNVQLSPSTIFEKVAEGFRGSPKKIFLLLSHQSSKYSVVPVEPDQIANQMIASLQYELMPFWENYYAFKFAFPQKATPAIDKADQQQLKLLTNALKDKEAYIVRHPYPLSFQKLYEAMAPFCEDADKPSVQEAAVAKQ